MRKTKKLENIVCSLVNGQKIKKGGIRKWTQENS